LLYRFFTRTILVLVLTFLLFGTQSVYANPAEKSKGVADYYKKKVTALVLKEQQQTVPGRILAFRHNGIIFLHAKEGPLHNPKPQYIPIDHIMAFLDETGKPLWGEIPQTRKYDFLKIRDYNVKFAMQYGVGRQISSYTFSPLVPDPDTYIQELQNGATFGGQIAYFLSPHYSVGVRYLRHTSKADIISLKSESEPPIRDNILIQNYMFDVTYYQSVSRTVILYLDGALGGLFYNIDRRSTTDAVELSGTSFSMVLSGGVDFLITRNIALGFELAYLFSSIENPDVQGNSEAIKASQNLNRFDVCLGAKFYF